MSRQLPLFALPDPPPAAPTHGLRGHLAELVDCGFSLPDALALHAHYAGLNVHIPHHAPDHHPLVAALGRPAADHLCRLAAGRNLSIPLQPYRPDHLAALVRRDLDAGHHRHTIARRYRITDRTITLISGRP